MMKKGVQYYPRKLKNIGKYFVWGSVYNASLCKNDCCILIGSLVFDYFIVTNKSSFYKISCDAATYNPKAEMF